MTDGTKTRPGGVRRHHWQWPLRVDTYYETDCGRAWQGHLLDEAKRHADEGGCGPLTRRRVLRWQRIHLTLTEYDGRR